MAACPNSSSCVFSASVEPSLVKRVRFASAYPYCKGGRHAECAIYRKMEFGEQVPRNLLPDGGIGDYLEDSGPSARKASSGTRFLVVDDSPVFATIAANTVRMRFPNAEVVQCHSFDEAEPELLGSGFSLIVSGHGLGGGRSFKDVRRLSTAPMVLFTGWPPAAADVPAGCRVVKKDAGPEALRAAIEGLIGA